MILSIAEDLTSTVSLDSELLSTPDSGMYLNTGVHPSINVNNLLQFLPKTTFTFEDYSPLNTYGKYVDSRKKSDLVMSAGLIYQSISASNMGNDPASFPNEWLLTNIESLRIKTFALNSQDNAIAKLNLNRRLVDSQYLYNVAEVTENPTATMLPSDYAAWVFEPKGSDYVKFQINEIAFQATTATPQSMYVVNQGVLVDTLTLNPNAEGRLVFEDISYVFSGKGKWYFIVDSQIVLTNGATIDSLKYEGFVAYMASGIGTTPESATYSYGTSNNGLNFNIKAYLDSSVYLNYNLVDYGQYLQSAWEVDVLEMFLHNSNNRSNRTERVQTFDRDLIIGEVKDTKSGGSAISKLIREKKKAYAKLKTTFDTELVDKNKGGSTNLRSV